MYPPRWPVNNSGNENSFSPWNLSLKNMCHWGDPLLTDFSGMTKMLYILYILWLGPKYTQSILKPKPKQQKSSTSWIGGASAGPGVDNDQGLAVPRQLQGSWMGRKDSLMMPNANKTMRKQWEYVENGGKRSKSWWHRIVILDYPDTSRHPRSCLQDS